MQEMLFCLNVKIMAIAAGNFDATLDGLKTIVQLPKTNCILFGNLFAGSLLQATIENEILWVKFAPEGLGSSTSLLPSQWSTLILVIQNIGKVVVGEV